MARAAADRYPTPSALADDVERWLADEPTTAWPEPWPVRARRWVGRQPATVRRGFVDELEVPAEAFLDHADGVTAAHPLCVLRLESDPGVERAEGPEPGTVDVSLLGRDHWVTVPADLPDDEVVLALFAAEWPAVRVRLPGYDAGGDLPDPWGGY